MDIMWPMMAGETGKRYDPFSENNNLFSILNRGVFIHEYREESYSFISSKLNGFSCNSCDGLADSHAIKWLTFIANI